MMKTRKREVVQNKTENIKVTKNKRTKKENLKEK